MTRVYYIYFITNAKKVNPHLGDFGRKDTLCKGGTYVALTEEILKGTP